MIPVLCTLLSAVGLYFSLNLGEVWPLAWLAPIPVLGLAFSDTDWRIAGPACWAAYALGTLNILSAYAGALPTGVLVIGVLVPGAFFACSALGARFVARRLSPAVGALAFAASWTTGDFLASLGRNGTAVSPAYSQVGAPVLVQGASVFGLWIVTFLLGFVPAGIAMSLARRRVRPAVAALVLFVANAAFGFARIADAAPARSVRVGLGADDSLVLTGVRADATSALRVIHAYVEAARTLAAERAALIVFPEKVAVLAPGWRNEAIARLRETARAADATIVIGFDDRDGSRLNDAFMMPPDGAVPARYVKRHLVPGLEDAFAPGHASLILPDRTGVAICKDMDFQATLRGDAAAQPTLLAVPAWDFDADAWWHARLAIMRGVENGFAVARAASDGLLTLTDAYGRVLRRESTAQARMVTVVGDVPRGPGDTIYRHVGDVFAWASVALAVLLLGLAFAKRDECPST